MSDLWVLITGASSGIGLELAKVFAKNGYHLVLTARRKDRLLKLSHELHSLYKIQVKICAGDLSESNFPKQLLEFTNQENLTIDILVNNAGFGDAGFFAESDWKKQDEMMRLNMVSLTQLTHLFLPKMLKRDSGRILNVSSVAAFSPGPLMSVYYASKAYVLHFSEALSNEVKGAGVTITCLCPGATRSEFQEKANMDKSRLFNLMSIPSSKEVAEFGYKSLMKEKRVAIHGFANKLLVFSARVCPRFMLAKIARYFQES